jgi:predicted amidohydrolase
VQFGSGLDREENRLRLTQLLDEANARSEYLDLVVLPEATARDFGKSGSRLAEEAEGIDGPFVGLLTDLAGRHGQTIVAGMFERADDPDRPFSTVVVVDQTGLRASYRKMHLYDSFGVRESDVLSAGPMEPRLVEIGGMTWGLMNCYDLRFPELARLLVDRGAHGLLLPAAWVAGPRKGEQWRTLLRARATENLLYVVAAGQPAPRYTGLSTVIDPRGDVLAEAGDGPDEVVVAQVSEEVVGAAREENPSLDNRRV